MNTGRIDVNMANPSDDGWTALHYASHEGHEQLVECLLRQFNAEVDI
jgi:ankyrin repeat protein